MTENKKDLITVNSNLQSGDGSPSRFNGSSQKKPNYLLAFILLLVIVAFTFSMAFKLLSILILIIGILILLTLKLVSKSLSLTSSQSSQSTLNESSKELKRKLFNLQYEANVSTQGELLYKQYESLDKKFSDFHTILNSKFNPTELTYDRYLSAVQSLYNSLISNFSSLENSFRILSKMNPQEETFIAKLKENQSYLELNKQALQEIEKLSFALNEIKTSNDSTTLELNDNLEQLKLLSERAKSYSTKN